MLKKFFYFYIFFSIFLIIYTNIINFTNANSSNNNEENKITEQISYFVTDSNNLFWPTPGYHKITSPFGNRISPITKKTSFHSGIDIGAQEGCLIYSASDGIVSSTGFKGANGYSIHVLVNNYTFIYGHVSPNFSVKPGDIISKRTNNSEKLGQNM